MSTNGNGIPEAKQVQISPLALLAAVLYQLEDGKSLVSVVPDDGGEPIEVETSTIKMEKDGDTLVCAIPMTAVAHFASIPYSMSFVVGRKEGSTDSKDDLGILTFERKEAVPTLVHANGQPIAQQTAVAKRLLEKLNGKDSN